LVVAAEVEAGEENEARQPTGEGDWMTTFMSQVLEISSTYLTF
jgi:hypothetical protein